MPITGLARWKIQQYQQHAQLLNSDNAPLDPLAKHPANSPH